MKLTKSMLKEFVKEVISETDGYPQMTNNNNEIEHN